MLPESGAITRQPVCLNCEHLETLHDASSGVCHAPGCSCRKLVRADEPPPGLNADQFERHLIEFNVDEVIDAEIARSGSPFDTLLRLKRAEPRCWVSPETSLLMLCYLEKLVRD